MNDTTDTKTAAALAKTPKLTKVQLIKRHIHAGGAYADQEIIEVVEHVADWLVKHEIGKRYTGSEPAANASK